MFGSIGKEKGLLFVTYNLQDVIANTEQALKNEVEQINANRLLNTAQSDLVRYLEQKYQIEPIRLRRDDRYATESEAQVDVRFDRSRWIEDTSRPAFRPGQRIEIHVPFDGESDLFYTRSSTFSMNPPRGNVMDQEIVLVYEMPSDAPRDIKGEIESTLLEIEQHINWQKNLIDQHNSSLSTLAEQVVANRRERLLSNSNRLSSLGIPIKVRDEASKTYAMPSVRRRAVPMLPPASTTPFEPEPVWTIEQYEHALNVIQQMTLVMERSPSAFRGMNEEALRQHFLVQLNGHFEGKASGETFNLEGKTDILLREGSRNVFIAECKFWKGGKKFEEAINQLLGYTAWRDTKTAILIFNRGKDITTILQSVKKVAEAHINFKRAVVWPHESGFRYMFHHNGDVNREFVMTILVFNVPN